ncbi:MAG: oligosaccharide flippase family protein [Ignavibacteriales bacterium]|nr:oligosaccharide flippase family protein [Ignavibacteriales bacterium]
MIYQKLKIITNNLTKSKKAKQIFILYLSMIIVVGLHFGISVINTQALGKQNFGDLKFIQNFFYIFSTVSTLGFFVSGGRLVALKENKDETHYIFGNLLLIASVISIILILIIIGLSSFQENIFNNKLGYILRIFAPLLFVFPFQFCIDNILQGTNKIFSLSLFRLLPYLLYFVSAIIIYYYFSYTLLTVLTLQMGSLTLIIVIFVYYLKPKFGDIKKYFNKLKKENKEYGKQVYIGFLTGVASSYLSIFLISYFIDNVNVGYYALAISLTSPLTLLPNLISTTYFKDFTSMNKIPKKLTLVTIFSSIIILVIYLLFTKAIVIAIYSAEYSAVVDIMYMVAIGSVLHGFGDYLNRFIGAHGLGREIRNSNFAVCFSNIFVNLLSIYLFGIIGAAFTKIISAIIYVLMMSHSYHKFKNLKI